MALSILSSASAMIMAAPRVYFAMACDGVFPPRLAGVDPRRGSPVSAIVAQSLWASLLLLSGTFEQLIVYSGFVVVLFSALAVAAVIVLRIRRPGLTRPFRVPFYPFTPLVFLAFSAWILLYTLRQRPWESILGILTAAAGAPIYFYQRRKSRRA
jgi:APA family basic amino acid/polyamine antiporter